MTIRKKILLYFSTIIPVIMAFAFVAIYILSSENREEIFQMRQKDKIATTLEILTDVKATDEELIDALEQISINDLFNDKLLLFNSKKQLIYSNIVDVQIPFSKKILNQLNEQNKWIETKDGKFDVIGTYIKRNNKTYFGISKAYDDLGYSKLHFLRIILVTTFVGITFIIIFVSFYISKKITHPLSTLTEQINVYDPSVRFQPIEFADSKDETAVLAHVFNDLMKRLNDTFSFQKHAIHHISHELKTPIAILVSNFERIEKEKDPTVREQLLINQKEDTKSLSEIINSLLEIAKIETGSLTFSSKFRVDELIFDVCDKLKNVFPEFVFFVSYSEPVCEDQLEISGNKRLLEAAISNLMENCIHYSANNQAAIYIKTEGQLTITFENTGKTLSDTESSLVFNHFFRGENSHGKKGFGLGLVFVSRIISLHNGKVSYKAVAPNLNHFYIEFP